MQEITFIRITWTEKCSEVTDLSPVHRLTFIVMVDVSQDSTFIKRLSPERFGGCDGSILFFESLCKPERFRCDGRPDCFDGKDEINCQELKPQECGGFIFIKETEKMNLDIPDIIFGHCKWYIQAPKGHILRTRS